LAVAILSVLARVSMNGSAGIAIIGRAPVARPAGTWRQLAASADGGLAWKTQRLTEDRPSGSFC